MKGAYILWMKLVKDKRICIGKLGVIQFKKGTYAYVGSAMNNLEKRIARHKRKHKRMHWHIDYFLKQAKIIRVEKYPSDRKKECNIAKNIRKTCKASIRGFGCSDCKCQSHLFRIKTYE